MALWGQSKAWSNHPITKMWKGYEGSLLAYGQAICTEWRNRGYKDTLLDWFLDQQQARLPDNRDPPWLGNLALHASHRGRLLAKDPEWYGQWNWTEDPCEHVIYITMPTDSVQQEGAT